ncbi:MAG TPA: hypothetical protein VIM25_11900 [Candidatus Limnocylindrales bacterium]
MTSDDALAFDRHLDASAPALAEIARALRLTVLEGFPDAVETFDPGDGLLADGANLPDADGRIEGTGKRIRHVKVRSVDDARGHWVRRVVAAQVAYREG